MECLVHNAFDNTYDVLAEAAFLFFNPISVSDCSFFHAVSEANCGKFHKKLRSFITCKCK